MIFPELFQLNRQLINELNEQLKKYDLFSSQWAVIHLLAQKGPMSLTAIWQTLQVEAPTTTRTVNRLVALGWVEKKPGADKRAKIIDLTPRAREQYPIILKDVKRHDEGKLAALTTEEQQQLLAYIQKLKG